MHIPMIHEPTVMETKHAHMSGAYVAECPECRIVCAYWDEDDLDENGDLICSRKRELTPREGQWQTSTPPDR